MEKTLFLKILCVIEFHPVNLSMHLGFMVFSIVLSSYSIVMVRREDIMIFVMSSFVVYLVSFLILLSIFLSETYHFIVEGNKIIIKRTISDKFKYEFTLSDKNIILGISNGSVVGNLIIIYSDKLLFKFLTTTKNVKIIQTKILNMGYRNGGMYKVCKTCGSINELDVNACDICGSRNLATYNLLWLD